MFEKHLWLERMTFFSDEHDGNVLEIYNMPNEDIYISIFNELKGSKNTVRISRSGGISTINPQFVNTATKLYRSLSEPIENLINKAHSLYKEINLNHYIVMQGNTPVVMSEIEFLDYLKHLFDNQNKYIDFSVFSRVYKFRLVKYSVL